MSRSLISSVISEVLSDHASDALSELVFELENSEAPLADFCDRFDLGAWFCEQMIADDIDIAHAVSAVADKHRKIERDNLRESETLHRELQSQGAL